MRKLENINPQLTSDILDKAGFHFDGYYYENADALFHFHKEEEGFIPTFKDPGLPTLDVALKDYAQFITFMYQALQFTIQNNIQQGKLAPDPNQLGKFIKDWWKFDGDIHYGIIFDKGGLAVVPNDEYTFSLSNGGIKQAIVSYSNLSDSNQQKEVKLECSPQCISYPFLATYIADLEGITSDQVEIKAVKLKDGDNMVPFFGMGIPKLHTQNK